MTTEEILIEFVNNLSETKPNWSCKEMLSEIQHQFHTYIKQEKEDNCRHQWVFLRHTQREGHVEGCKLCGKER